MNEDEKLIRAKLRSQKFGRGMQYILLVEAAIALAIIIFSTIYVTWIK